jgi:polysaccharide chain length determinant protein (PEP-CTERM system associated)
VKELLDQLLEQIRGAWRYRWAGLAVAWGVCLLGWVAALLLPNSYAASARVFVDTQTALGEATRGITLDSSVDSQIQRVRQTLLGGPKLGTVAEEAGLTADALTPQERQFVVERLRSDIQISGGPSRDSPGAGVYLLSYNHSNRDTSLRVVELLVNSFVEGALGGKREGSETAQRFLVEQIADYERRLGEAEQRLAAFKKANVGLMPGAQGDYFSRLQADMDALSEAQTDLSVASRRRDQLRRQLQGEQPFITTPGGSGVSVPSAPTAAGGDTALRIREAQQRLDELLLRYTEKHPDVVALRGTILELEERQAREIEAARRGDTGAVARTGLNANPVFQNLQLQYNQVDVEIAALSADIADRQRRIASLRGLINTAPEVEAEFSRLNRDYEVTRAQYQALVERLERARLGESAAETGVIRFEVIDPPTAPFAPVAPNRPALILASLVLGLLAGGALAYVLHMIRPVFASARQLNEITGLPVLGVVSMTWIERYQAGARRSALKFAAATGGLVALGVLTLAAQQTLVRWVRGWIA